MKYMQSFYLAAGKRSCYALCLVGVARKWWEKNRKEKFPLSDTDALIGGIERKYLSFNEFDYMAENNFYVGYPDLFLSYMTGGMWTVTKEKADYMPAKDEFAVDFWAKNERDADKGIGHFVFEENTLQKSETVRVGQIFSKRILKKIR